MSPQPVVSPLTQKIYDYLANLGFARKDEAAGWALLRWSQGYANLLENVYRVVKKNKVTEKEGWSPLTDADEAFALTMPFLAQLLGTQLKVGDTEANWRSTIKDAAGLYQGTPKAIAGELQKLPFMFNLKRVYLFERDSSNYHFAIGFNKGDAPSYLFQQNFENADFSAWTLLDTGVTVQDSAIAHAGTHSMQINFPTTVFRGAGRSLGVTMKAGEKITIQLYTNNQSSGFRDFIVVVGNDPLAGSDHAQGNYGQTNVAGWVGHALTYTAVNAGSPNIWIYNNTGSSTSTILVDDIQIEGNFLSDTDRALVDASVLLQKPIGHLYSTRIIEVGEWTYFVLQAIVYSRDVDGFIVEDPPFADYTELNAAYLNYTNLNANIPI